MPQLKLTIVPCTIKEANEFVRQHHRHHKPLKVGYYFALAVSDEAGNIRGVAIVGRPATIALDNGWTAEVRRVATDGCPNACSALYGACRRAAFALGYRKVVTYILNTEPGISLKAAGWKCIGERGGGTWDRPNCGRPRVDMHPTQTKIRWEAE